MNSGANVTPPHGRVVALDGAITSAVAEQFTAHLLYLATLDAHAPVTVTISSPGGELAAGLAICDAMEMAGVPVVTWCARVAGGVAALLLAAGTPGCRHAAATARVALSPTTAAIGMPDTAQLAYEFAALDDRYVAALARRTGQSQDAVRRDCAAGRTLDAREARAYGIVDAVA